MSDTTPADASSTDAMTLLAETGDPESLFEHPSVSTDTSSFEPDEPADFSHFHDWDGMAIAGITNDAGEVLLVKHTDPEHSHDWVLPHGRVAPEDEWAETAIDWVDGLTGVDATLTKIVHVRRNDITLDREDGSVETTMNYHVVFAGQPTGDTTIETDVRYDCDDEWIADWYDHVPESARETESGDIALFVD